MQPNLPLHPAGSKRLVDRFNEEADRDAHEKRAAPLTPPFV
jgi:hypothetical protein